MLLKGELSTKIPDDWHVVLTDIKDSTTSIKSGKHEAINLIATESIMSCYVRDRKD